MHRTSCLLSLSLTALLWLPPAARAAVDFAKDIQPIFQKTCVECHGPDKQKGKLRLDSKAAGMKGGSSGAVIIPGDAAKSDLYRRVTLAATHDDFMPTKGKPLPKAQTDALRDWINQGASWPETPGAAKATTPAATDSPGPKPTAAELKAIAELAKLGVNAREIAMGLNWRQANFRAAGEVDARAFAQLKDILSLQELNLGTTKITDADLLHLRGLTNLTVLHLEHTKITDAGLEHLKRLGRLRYLNLFGTAVTDAGLKHLAALPGLRVLYVAETKVTEAGAAELKKARPQVEVNRGWTLPPPPATPAPAPAPEKKP